jgi:S1-C subfamily serine protease
VDDDDEHQQRLLIVSHAVEDAAAAHAGSTAQILTLGPGTPAAQSGLKAGDVILSIDGIPVTRSEDVLDAAYFLTAGDLVEVRIQRDGETRSISVKPTTRPVLPVETMALGN